MSRTQRFQPARRPGRPFALSALGAAFVSLALLAPASHAATQNARDALTRLETAGYVASHALAYRHGLWTADSTTPAGKRVTVVLDPNTDTLIAVDAAAFGTTLPTATQVRQRLQAAGYRDIRDIEFDDGFWEAEARNAAGYAVDLVLHPTTVAVLAEVFDGAAPSEASLSAQQIRAALEAAGYYGIRDLEYDDGMWEADATNAQGQRVELKIDPATGQVLREQLDD